MRCISARIREWGYEVGSVYIRKVHFRDRDMIDQIEQKVVNRLRQVTGAIKQDGAHGVSLIPSGAERKAAVEFAKAAATRPQIVGKALAKISRDMQILDALFDVMEAQNQLKSGQAEVTILPSAAPVMLSLTSSAAPSPIAAALTRPTRR